MGARGPYSACPSERGASVDRWGRGIVKFAFCRARGEAVQTWPGGILLRDLNGLCASGCAHARVTAEDSSAAYIRVIECETN